MDAATAAIIAESERILNEGNDNAVQVAETDKKGLRNKVTGKKKKRKELREPKFGDRLDRLSEAEINYDEKEHLALVEESKELQGKVKKKIKGRKKGSVHLPTLKEKPKDLGRGTLGDREWENELSRNLLSIYYAVEGNKGQLSQSSANEGEESQSVSLPKLEQESNRQNALVKRPLRPPKHIWFAGTGALRTVWCALSDEIQIPDNEPVSKQLDPNLCSHRICLQLRHLENHQMYEEYLETVEELLQGYSRRVVNNRCEKRQKQRLKKDMRGIRAERLPRYHDDCGHSVEYSVSLDQSNLEDMEDDDTLTDNGIDYEILDPTLFGEDAEAKIEIMMWRQFVVCCYTFGIKHTEQGKYTQGLELLKRAEAIIESGSALEGGNAFTGRIKLQFQGFVWDSLGYYYIRRRKLNAAALYAQKAMRLHVKLENWEHVAKCHLHCGTILSKMSKHEESIKCMAQVLQMVEDERLQVGGTNAQKICLVAVCYHNIAVEQIVLSRPAEACVSSQNARRLARLSLSYSNRWINSFESTHQIALRELADRHSYIKPNSKPKPRVDDGVVRKNLSNKEVKQLYKKIATNI